MIQKFRKKPVVIEAIQLTKDNYDEVCNFIGVNFCKKDNGLIIFTLEGNMRAKVGDFIIKGVNGEFYPCKPDIFFQTYEIEN